MVEKIIITPEKVRAYGNIILPKSATDFTTNGGLFSYGTEKVNGQNNTVYKLISNAFFYDSGVTPTNNTSDWYYDNTKLTLTPSSTGTTVTDIAGDSNVQVLTANKPGTTAGGYDYTKPFQVEVDILSYTADSSANIQVYDGTNNVYRRFDALGIGATTGANVKVKVLTDKVEFYVNGELTYTSSTRMGTSRTALRLGADGNTIKFKNFIVRDL